VHQSYQPSRQTFALIVGCWNYHAVCSHTYPSWTQVGGVGDCGSTTHVFMEIRHRCCSSPCLEQSPVLTSCDRLCWLLCEKKTWKRSYNAAFMP